jgi:hypothetical protein
MPSYEERMTTNPDGHLFVDFIFKRSAYAFTVEKDGEHAWYMCPITKKYPYEEYGDMWRDLGEDRHVPRCLIKRAKEMVPVLLIALNKEEK